MCYVPALKTGLVDLAVYISMILKDKNLGLRSQFGGQPVSLSEDAEFYSQPHKKEKGRKKKKTVALLVSHPQREQVLHKG